MRRIKELTFRVLNAILIGSLRTLYRAFGSTGEYRVSGEGAAARFEGNWYVYRPAEFGSTGNIDFQAEAENATRDALFSRTAAGEVFYDIGAHGGVFTITALSRNPRLIVHSFEPQPEDLLENLRLNGLSDENVHGVAVGAENGNVSMTSNRRSSNHVSSTGDRSVRMVRIDDYVSEMGLPSPDWIKIDIEGLELPALRGAEKLLRASCPTIVCEINHLFDRFGTSLGEFTAYLTSLGYDVCSLRDGALKRVPASDTLAALGFSDDNNFWFVHKTKLATSNSQPGSG